MEEGGFQDWEARFPGETCERKMLPHDPCLII